MHQLARFGTVKAYAELRRELVRPAWTDSVDVEAISDAIRPNAPKLTDEVLLFKWVEATLHEESRPMHAAAAIMILTGHVPRGMTRWGTDAFDAQKVAEEFDSAAGDHSGRSRREFVTMQVGNLFNIVMDRDEEGDRIAWAIWILMEYAGWPRERAKILPYVERTPAQERVQAWRRLKDTLPREIGWDFDKGEATGLAKISTWSFVNLGL